MFVLGFLYYFVVMVSNWLPFLIAFSFVGIVAVILIFLAYKIIAYKRELIRLRINIESLCSWSYSAIEWKHYAELYDLCSEPNGAAKLKITPLDIWIEDDKNLLRKELDGDAKCVTDCRFANNILKLRVRWWETYGKGGKYYYFNDFLLPVPSGKEKDAAKVVNHFKEYIATHTKKVSNVTPKETFNGLFGEVDF